MELKKRNRNRLTDTENKQVVGRRERKGKWAKQMKGINRYTLPVTQVSHGDETHSTGNTVKDTVINLYANKRQLDSLW